MACRGTEAAIPRTYELSRSHIYFSLAAPEARENDRAGVFSILMDFSLEGCCAVGDSLDI